MPNLSREQQLRQDAEELQKLGYAQQLLREMGGFSNFALSFSIISILTGAILLFGYGLKFAGPVINTVGWPIVTLFTLTVAASMAELASAYPTAGGLYFWSYRLGGRGWAWLTAWLNMAGQITITAGINLGASIYLIGAFLRIFGIPQDIHLPVFGSPTNWYFQIVIMVLITIPQVLINIFGIKLTAKLNDFSVWWHIAGVIFLVVVLSAFGLYHNPPDFLFLHSTSVNPLEAASAKLANGTTAPALVFGDFTLASPLFNLFPALTQLYQAPPFIFVFLLALLQAQWTYTGYDASAHMAEETILARLGSAWGIFLSVAVSGVAGYILLLVLTWCIPAGDVAATASDPYPVLYVLYQNLKAVWANTGAILIGGAMWLCGLSAITSMSRMWYAFARDDGMPGARWIKQINPRYGTPIHAIVLTTCLAVVLCLYSAAYYVVSSISTATLYLAYVIPIYLNWRNKRRRQGESTTPENAPWNLGRWGPILNAIAIVWALFITVLFSIPPNELVLWSLLLFGLALVLYWHLHAKQHFRGPAGRRLGTTP